MAPVHKFFLRSNPDRKTIERMVQYVRDFGQGKVAVEQNGRLTILFLDRREDVELFKHQFGHMIDAEADLTS